MADPAEISGAAALIAAAAPSYWWVSPVATIVAAMAGGVFAYYQISAGRQMTRLKASLDLIESAFVRDWREVEDFVWTLRHPPKKPPRTQLFVAFERLAKEWGRELISEGGSRTQ